MMSRVFLSLLLPLTLLSCAGRKPSRESITLERYHELEYGQALQAKEFKVTCQLLDGKGKVLTSPTLMLRPHQTGEVEMTRDFVYPDSFQMPQTSKTKLMMNEGGAFPVTPTTPRSFSTRQVGLKLSLKAQTQGAFVVVDGMLSSDEFVGFALAGGEAVARIMTGKPHPGIVLTENKVSLPQWRRNEARVHVAGLPEVPHRIEYPALDKTLVMTVSVVK